MLGSKNSKVDIIYLVLLLLALLSFALPRKVDAQVTNNRNSPKNAALVIGAGIVGVGLLSAIGNAANSSSRQRKCSSSRGGYIGGGINYTPTCSQCGSTAISGGICNNCHSNQISQEQDRQDYDWQNYIQQQQDIERNFQDYTTQQQNIDYYNTQDFYSSQDY